jgi:hypothetical protein
MNPLTAIIAAVDTAIAVCQSPAGGNEGSTGDTLHEFFHRACITPSLPTTTGLGRKTAETVCTRRLFGQTTADRGENAPNNEQHDDNKQDSLHDDLPARAEGDEYTPASQFGIRRSEFRNTIRPPIVCFPRGEDGQHCDFRILNRIPVASVAVDFTFEAREVGDGRVALLEFLQSFQSLGSVIVLVEIELVDHDLVVPGLPVTGVDSDSLVE